MVTTFAEYLLAEREGSFEMRPVFHNLISLCCSLSLSITNNRFREGMQEISFSCLHFVKTGQCEIVVAGVVCRDCFRASIYSGKGRWIPWPGWGGEGGGSCWQTLAPKTESCKGRAHGRLSSM